MGEDRLVRWGVGVLGVYMLALGVLSFAAPGAFFEAIGPYGAENHHYVRDVGSFHLAFGVLAVAAVPRPAWHAPVLLLAVVQFATHTVSHAIDVGATDPGWLGPVELGGLAAGTALVAFLLVRRMRTAGG